MANKSNKTNKSTSSVNTLTETHAHPSNEALVKPETVSGGEGSPSSSDTAKAWHEQALSSRAQETVIRSQHMAAVNSAFAEYDEAVALQEKNVAAGQTAKTVIETATSNISRAMADAVTAGVFGRKEARHKLGEKFGFEPSKTTGKATSRPCEPGNTIAKRVSSVTIALEYAMTGQLPDNGGKNLPLIGPDKAAELLEEYVSGEITVRAASERIEAAIREAKVSVPLEMNADKLLSLAGKIAGAAVAIADDAELAIAYRELFLSIASIPFPTDAD